MRLESPDGKLVQLKDGNERVVLVSDAAGAVALPATTVASLSVTAGMSAATAVLGGATVAIVTRSADVAFSPTQIKALNAPATLVASPGTGLALVFEGAVLFYDYGATAFTIGTASGLAVRYTDGSGLQVGQSLVAGLLDQTADKFRWIKPWTPASGDSSVVPVAASPLVLQMLTADVTGSVTGTVLRARTYYRVVPAVL